MLRQKIIFVTLLAILSLSLLAVGARVMHTRSADPAPAADLPSLQEEYSRLMKKYASVDSSICIGGEVVLYDGSEPGVEKERSPFTYMRSGEQFYSSLSFQKTYFNGKMLVQVDSLHKIVFIAEVTDSARKVQAKRMGSSGLPGLSNKLFADTAAFRLRGTVTGNDKLRSIVLSSDYNPEIARCELDYSPVDYSVKSAEIRFFKSGKKKEDGSVDDADLWISRIGYREVTKQPLDVDALLRKIFVVKNRTLFPTAEYVSYKVIIQ